MTTQFTLPLVASIYDPGPSEAELFLHDPANWVLLGILAAVAIGVVVPVRKKTE